MQSKLKKGSIIAIGVTLALTASCNQNKPKFSQGSTLTIKCLKEVVSYEDHMEEIVEEFEKAYPNVKVNLDLQEATTENIKEVNEALKRGGGEDIIIGNALPFQTYAEKGYLLDITNCVESAEKEMKVQLFDQMKKSYLVNEKIYAEACGFKLYAVQGSETAVEAGKSAQKLSEQMSQEYLLHPEMKVRTGDEDYAKLVYPINIDECWDTLYDISTDEMYDDSYEVNVNEMESLLSAIKELKEITYGEEDAFLYAGTSGSMRNQIGDMIAGHYPTALGQVWQTSDLFSMQGYRDWKEKKFALLENEEGKPYYSTCYVVGISANNKNKKLAEEFVKYMLTYQESTEYLPIARTYMEKNLQGIFKMDDEKENHTPKDKGYVTTPEVKISKADQEKLLKDINAAVLIENEDGAIKHIVTKYAQEYINNGLSLEEVINAIQEEISNYMYSL